MNMKFINHKGFTIIELMIVVAISSVVMGAAFHFLIQQRNMSESQEQLTDIQQSLRNALYLMTSDIMMVGYDPEISRDFGLTYIGRTDSINTLPSVAATDSSRIEFTIDLGATGNDNNGSVEANEFFSYAIYDFGNDGNLDLGRDTGTTGLRLVAENIIAMGISYAYDIDNDKELDTYTDASGDEQIIWAVDTDNDTRLDLHLDTNLDGIIDENDAPNAAAKNPLELIVAPGGAPAFLPVQMKFIRAVKVSLLAQGTRADPNFYDNRPYIIGQRIITPNNTFRHRSLERIVKCRNLGLQ